MFYLKVEIGEGCEIKAEITDENVFTVCPVCGKEHAIDLAEILSDGESDLFSTQIFCAECSKKYQKTKEEEV